jgi:hypothetical protein
MDNDDIFRGRILSRREMLGFLGLGGAAAVVMARTGGDDQEGPASTPASGQAEATVTSVPPATTPSGGELKSRHGYVRAMSA